MDSSETQPTLKDDEEVKPDQIENPVVQHLHIIPVLPKRSRPVNKTIQLTQHQEIVDLTKEEIVDEKKDNEDNAENVAHLKRKRENKD